MAVVAARSRLRRSVMALFVKALRALSLAACAVACSRAAHERGIGDEAGAAPHASMVDAAGEEEGGEPDRHASHFDLGPLPGGAPFEGKVVIRVGTVSEGADQQPATYTFWMKGKKVRWDLFGGGGKGGALGLRIYDGAQRKFFTVLQKPFVYETDAAALVGDAGTSGSPAGAPHYKFTPFKLDPKGAVSGMPCDRLETADDHSLYDVCVASGMPTLPLDLLGSSVATVVPFGTVLEEKGQFPLYVMVRRKELAGSGRDAGPLPAVHPAQGSMRVVTIERGVVPAEAFELPDYPVVKIAGFTPSAPLR